MSFFKKKEEAPRIPDAPGLPEINFSDSSKESLALPTLPGDARDSINQGMIKSAIGELSAETKGDGEEFSAIHFAVAPEPAIQKENPEMSFRAEPVAVKKDLNDTIFIRMDKFNLARRDVQDIAKDLKQIRDVVEKINKIKAEEDAEISEINSSIEDIKSRLNKIDAEIFNKI